MTQNLPTVYFKTHVVSEAKDPFAKFNPRTNFPGLVTKNPEDGGLPYLMKVADSP